MDKRIETRDNVYVEKVKDINKKEKLFFFSIINIILNANLKNKWVNIYILLLIVSNNHTGLHGWSY